MKKRIAAIWSRWFPSRAQSAAALVCLLVALLLALFLVEARKPWDGKILARIAAGRELKFDDFIAIGLWWAALANLGGALLLGFTARWWMRPLPQAHAPPEPPRPAPRGFAVCLLGAMAICLVFCWPRLPMSFWGDEEHGMRQVIFGKYLVSPDGEVTLDRQTYAQNLWMYRGPNNHPLFTQFSRLSQEIYHGVLRGDRPDYSETASRIPSLVAGLLGLWATGVLLLRLGYPWAGALAAFLLAFHPWYIKYASEARGYGMLLLFLLLACLSLHHAWRTFAWRWWIGFAAALFAALYTYPAALYPCATLGAAALAGIWLSREQPAAARRQATARLAVSGSVAAMLYLQLIAPCIPQMALYLQRDRARGEVDFAWLRDVWGYLNGGIAWTTWDRDNPLCLAVEQLPPSLFWPFAILLPVLVVAGAIRLGMAGTRPRLLLAALLLAPALALLHARGSGHLLYVWYLIYAILPFALCAAAGLTWPFAALPSRKLGLAGGAVAGALLVAWYACVTLPQREILCAYPLEAQRESVLSTRPTLDPYDPVHRRILTAQFVFTTPLYDPHAVLVKSADQLRGLMGKADRERKPLYVNFASEGWARHTFPEIMALLDDPNSFVKHRVYYGLDAQMTRLVYRYRGGGPPAGER